MRYSRDPDLGWVIQIGDDPYTAGNLERMLAQLALFENGALPDLEVGQRITYRVNPIIGRGLREGTITAIHITVDKPTFTDDQNRWGYFEDVLDETP